jgi:hypothetical protein
MIEHLWLSPLVLRQTKAQKVEAAWSAVSTFWALCPNTLGNTYIGIFNKFDA